MTSIREKEELIPVLLETIYQVYGKLEEMAKKQVEHISGEKLKTKISGLQFNHSLFGGIDDIVVPYDVSINFKRAGKIKATNFDSAGIIASMTSYGLEVGAKIADLIKRFTSIVNALNDIKQKKQPRSKSLDIIVKNADGEIEYEISPAVLYRDLCMLELITRALATLNNTYAAGINKYLAEQVEKLKPLAAVDKYVGPLDQKLVGRILDRES